MNLKQQISLLRDEAKHYLDHVDTDDPCWICTEHGIDVAKMALKLCDAAEWLIEGLNLAEHPCATCPRRDSPYCRPSCKEIIDEVWPITQSLIDNGWSDDE